MPSSFTDVFLNIDLSFYGITYFPKSQNDIIKIYGVIIILILNELGDRPSSFCDNIFHAPLYLLQYMSQVGFGVKGPN